MELKKYYQQRKEEAESKFEAVKKEIRKVSACRVLIFIIGCISMFYLYPYGVWGICCIIACTTIPFLLLMKRHNYLFQNKDWWRACITHYQEEIDALQGNVSSYEDGKEYMDSDHPYTLDLDIFGPRSLFQTINRTCTPLGKATLAAWLKDHLRKKALIEDKQEAIKELTNHNELREKFRITGLLFKERETNFKDIDDWIKSPDYFSTRRWYQWTVWIAPRINSILLILGVLDIIPMNYIGFSFGCFLVISLGLVKKITLIRNEYEKQLSTLSTYAQLIQLIENEKLQSPLLVKWKEHFKSHGQPVSTVLSLLTKELDRLDLRNNQLLYFLLEGGLFWQVRQMLRIEQWKQTYGKNLHLWLSTLGEMDAIMSIGTFAFNHPDYTYPIISNKPFIFESKGMGHPLMPVAQCVRNNASIPYQPYFIIITGANMAGKSTYLRTIGCNYVLACIGAPVCCESLKIYPAQLMTSLRTSDSLSNNESYFFAELKRLKQIIDRLNKKEEMFIILDEILKGTNSKDKQKGSFSLIKQLISLKANGIIATHDLVLGELAEYFPHEIKNYCFEADIQENELTFSYKLKEGIAQNMNACFLMEKMGLIIND